MTESWELALAARVAAAPAGTLLKFERALTNADRSTGAALSGELLRRAESSAAAAKPRVRCRFHGAAGQSFGAFLIRGLCFQLQGEANDYAGKGLSGGEIAIAAGAAASVRGDVLAGNTVLYGATSGRLAIAGRAGERFAVRNSGAVGMVEGLGQHGCEYMTAGVAVVLGPVGANFGAGMTGGLAYVPEAVAAAAGYHADYLRPAPGLEPEERQALLAALGWHAAVTGSPVAAAYCAAPERLVRLEPVAPPCPVMEVWRAAWAGAGGAISVA
ncbi:MAG: hypothetical protein ACRD13_10525 [Terriglobales bacterium]